MHVVDISENNTVELVRDIRINLGYGTVLTFAIDCGSIEFDAMLKEHGPYDYIFNLSALKHVRSEKDPLRNAILWLIFSILLNLLKL